MCNKIDRYTELGETRSMNCERVKIDNFIDLKYCKYQCKMIKIKIVNKKTIKIWNMFKNRLKNYNIVYYNIITQTVRFDTI